VLTFFIAGLLYLLRFERVDNLGAYSIPSETGLLIPSDYNTWVQLFCLLLTFGSSRAHAATETLAYRSSSTGLSRLRPRR